MLDHGDHKSDAFPVVSSVLFTDKQTSVMISVHGLPPKENFYSNFSIANEAGIVVDTKSTTFFSKHLKMHFTTELIFTSQFFQLHLFSGTYSVQSAKITHLTGTSNVEVTCSFAINAPAAACMAFFENSVFGLKFHGIILHSPGSMLSSGIVEIPQEVLQEGVMQGLSSIVFNVKVFDVNMNGLIEDWPSVEQRQALEVGLSDVKLSADMPTTHTAGKKCCCCLLIIWTHF